MRLPSWAPTPADAFLDSAARATDLGVAVAEKVPIVGNALMCGDSLYLAGRAGINFYCCPNILAKVCFGASCLCGTAGALASGTAALTGFLGIPTVGLVGTVGGRTFNNLGKYALKLGNVTNGNITNITEIYNLMD